MATMDLLETYVQNSMEENRYNSIDSLANGILDLGIEFDMEKLAKLYHKYDVNDKINSINHIGELWSKAEQEIMPLLVSKLSIMVEVTIKNKKYRALIDTGAEANIMSKKIIEDCELWTEVDKNYRANVSGVEGGTKMTIGYIPYLNISVGQFEVPCPFIVMDHDSIDMILSQAFLTYYRATLDFENNVLKINGNHINMYICDSSLGSAELF